MEWRYIFQQGQHDTKPPSFKRLLKVATTALPEFVTDVEYCRMLDAELYIYDGVG